MAALIPMCRLRNFKQIYSLTGIQFYSNVEVCKISRHNAVNRCHISSRKCLYSTESSKISNDESFKDRNAETAQNFTDKNSNDSNKSKDKDEKQNFMKKHLKKIYLGTTLSGAAFLVFFIHRWGAPLEDPAGNEIKDEFSDDNVVVAYCRRAWKEVFREVETTQRPSRDKLLPDPLTYPYIQPKYTLVIEMTDVLVHPEWTYGTGWRFKKRPGIDQFLKAVGPPMFEVVIFTQDNGFTADPIITKIDPENYVMYRLYRDATHFMNGHHKKDLNYLNRDLSKVIMIDWNKESVNINPENSFLLKQWTGEDKDTTLGELGEFLRAIATLGVDDVRPVLQYYHQFDDPLKQFRENQRKLKEEQDRQAQLQKDAQQSRIGFSMGGLWRR